MASECTAATLASHIDFTKLKACPHLQVVHKLQYDAETNVIKAGWPQYFLTHPVRLKSDVESELF